MRHVPLPRHHSCGPDTRSARLLLSEIRVLYAERSFVGDAASGTGIWIGSFVFRVEGIVAAYPDLALDLFEPTFDAKLAALVLMLPPQTRLAPTVEVDPSLIPVTDFVSPEPARGLLMGVSLLLVAYLRSRVTRPAWS
jgi:hypothetical protein